MACEHQLLTQIYHINKLNKVLQVHNYHYLNYEQCYLDLQIKIQFLAQSCFVFIRVTVHYLICLEEFRIILKRHVPEVLLNILIFTLEVHLTFVIIWGQFELMLLIRFSMFSRKQG